MYTVVASAGLLPLPVPYTCDNKIKRGLSGNINIKKLNIIGSRRKYYVFINSAGNDNNVLFNGRISTFLSVQNAGAGQMADLPLLSFCLNLIA